MTDFGLMMHLPCGPFAAKEIKSGESARETEDQMGDGDGLAGQTGRCLWAIIYKLFNLGYFLALGNG